MTTDFGTITALFASTFLALAPLPSRAAGSERLPIIDMHLHALPADRNGPPPASVCLDPHLFLPIDVSQSFTPGDSTACAHRFSSPVTDQELMVRSLEALETLNIIGVASGPLEYVQRWWARSPTRIIPAISFAPSSGWTPERLRTLVEKGEVRVLGEVVTQYRGLSPADSTLAPYWALAEELDLPVGIHMGLGPPGAPYLGSQFRASLSNPLLLEEVLVRHPKLRVYVMHAGWPMLDEMVHLLYTHPQVYVDTGVIDWAIPRAEFYFYLRRLVEAGFGKRIMYGSDQMVWPEAIEASIESVRAAQFLTDEQKRDIFYNNAARFLRLSPEEIAAHHGSPKN